MADYQVTSATFDALLKEDYITQEIVDAINKATVFKSKLTRTQTIDGRRAIYAVQVAVAQGNGSRAEGAALPNYGAGQFQDAIVNTFSHYARFIVTGQAEVFSSRNAFVQFVERTLKDTKEGLMLNIGRQSWGDGTGTISLTSGSTAQGSTTFTAGSAYGVLWGSVSTNTTMLYRPGMILQFVNYSTGAPITTNGGQGYTVTGITGTTITFSPMLDATVASGSRVTLVGSYNQEMEGWLKMVATAAFMTGNTSTTLNLGTTIYHNIDRNTATVWNGNVTDAAQAALSLTLIRAIKDALFVRGGLPDLCIGSTQVVRDYEALLTPNQRYVPAIKLEGGATAIEHDGLPFTKDKDAPAQALNLVKTDEIRWAQRNDPDFIRQGDQILQKVTGYDMKEAVLRWYANLDTPEPRYQAMLYNLLVAP
jgi:hypothetical protein